MTLLRTSFVMLLLVSSKTKGPALSAVAQERSNRVSSLTTGTHLTAVLTCIRINVVYNQPLL